MTSLHKESTDSLICLSYGTPPFNCDHEVPVPFNCEIHHVHAYMGACFMKREIHFAKGSVSPTTRIFVALSKFGASLNGMGTLRNRTGASESYPHKA